MSATYNNQIEIVLFPNTKAVNPKAPQHTGTVTFPDGTKYEVAMWAKKSQRGTEFMAGTLKPKTDEFQAAEQRTQRSEPRSSGNSRVTDF